MAICLSSWKRKIFLSKILTSKEVVTAFKWDYERSQKVCMAIYKPKDGKLPGKATLQYIWSNNRDGAGYMVIEGKLCHITKGFLTFKDFWAHLKSNSKITASSEVILHFRYATAGAIDGTCTHPFPITEDIKKLKTSVITCSQAVVHNGVFDQGEEDLSDTMTFVRDTLWPLRKYFNDPGIIALISHFSWGNRLAIVSNGKVHLTGDWIENRGIYYSTSDFKKKKKTKKNSNKIKISKKGSSHTYTSYDSYDSYDQYYMDGKTETRPGEPQVEHFEHELFNVDVPYCPYCGSKDYVTGYWSEFLCIACGVAFDVWEDKEDAPF